MSNNKLFALLFLTVLTGQAHADEAQLKRGAQVAVSVCNGCHNLKYLKYSDFLKLGFTKAEVDGMRGDKAMDSPLYSQMDAQSELSMFGIVPPDLSLMAKAREGGAHYIYSMITGFYTDAKGQTANRVFPGVKMPDVLMVAQADPAARKDIEAKAKDVSAFLEWASDPQAEERKTLGRYVIVYFAVLTALLYFLKKKIWKRLD